MADEAHTTGISGKGVGKKSKEKEKYKKDMQKSSPSFLCKTVIKCKLSHK